MRSRRPSLLALAIVSLVASLHAKSVQSEAISLLAPEEGAIVAPTVRFSWSCDHRENAKPCLGVHTVEVMNRRTGRRVCFAQDVRTNVIEDVTLDPGETYTWCVWCGKEIRGGSFRTEGVGGKRIKHKGKPVNEEGLPKWHEVEALRNFRDLGGWKGLDGRRVKTGLVYRSEQLDKATNRTRDVLVGKLGIRTELDLRTPDVAAPLQGCSPLGSDVVYTNLSSSAYSGFEKESGRENFATTFRWFIKDAVYPVVFHCAKGADRTGSWAFLLNGLLGVSEADLRFDWEVTSDFNSNPQFKHHGRYDTLVAMVLSRPGVLFTDKIVSFAHECGITDAEIESWRNLMLEPATTDSRIAVIDPVKLGELRLRPTFESCSVCYGVGANKDVRYFYRRVGETSWQEALKPPYFPETGDCRGSLLGLSENTRYEVQVTIDGQEAARGEFRTWVSEVPIARTIELDPAKVCFPIRIQERGSADGWIRYRVKPGDVLVNPTDRETIIIDGARYVTLDDSVIRGSSARHAIVVANSSHIRIRNCDVSHWGRTGEQDFFNKGFFYTSARKGMPRSIINYDGAIEIDEHVSEIVIERCWIHDPNGTANSWRYYHPAGPEAITIKKPDHSTVIRWCDFTGSDEHRWNDAVESLGNFDEWGGLNRDADVYGNFMNMCNDDCIELDGGQQNVRCFGNRFESSLCGVSIQGNMVSPSYVYDNLFSGMGERFGECGQTIKTSQIDPKKKGVWNLVHDNILWGGGSGLILDSVREGTRYDVRRNVFCGSQSMTGLKKGRRPDTLQEEENVIGRELKETDLDVKFPRRPIKFELDRTRFSTRFFDEVPKMTVTAISSDAQPISFSIAKNDAFDWFDVTPAVGVIPPDGKVAFSVKIRNERMSERRFWRGSFLVRTPEGMSRPFTFELENGSFVEPFHCERSGELAVYADVEPFDLVEEREFTFDWPKDARGFFLLRLMGGMNASYEISVDGSEWVVSHVQGFPNVSNWSLVNTRGGLWRGRVTVFSLKAGSHRLKIRPANSVAGRPEHIRVEGAVLTDSPGSFEPR